MASEPGRRGAAWLAFGAIWLGSCTSLEGTRQEVESEVAEEVRERLGLFYPPPWDPVDAADPSEESARLLEEGLTEERAVRVALLENRRLRADFERLGVAAYDRVRAELLRNPVLDGVLWFFDPGTEIELGLSQPLVDLFQRSLRRELAEVELLDARLAVLEGLVQVVFGVRRGLLGAVAQEQRQRLAEAELLAVREAEALAAELHRAGNLTDLELSRYVRARVEAELAALSQAQRSVELREQLTALLGLAELPGTTLRLAAPPGELPAAAARGDLDTAVARNLTLGRFDAHLAGARSRADLPRHADVLSEAQVGLSAAKDSGESALGLGPLVVVPIPVFDTGAANQASARAAWRALHAEREALRRELLVHLRTLGWQRSALVAQATLARDEYLAASNRVMLHTLQQYNVMQIGAFHVLEERSREIHAERKALDLWERAWLAHWHWEQAQLGSAPLHPIPQHTP